jgi:hypothetical protein
MVVSECLFFYPVRGFISKPRVARLCEVPWGRGVKGITTLKGLHQTSTFQLASDATPSEKDFLGLASQGSSLSLSTLGFVT